MDLQTELRSVQFASYPKIFGRLRELAAQYGDLPMDAVSSAFMRAASNTYTRNNPYIQNRRVKAISSLPVNYSKDKVAEMLTAPDGNEQGLRQVAHALEWTAYPLFHTRKVYTEMLTYHSYIAPEYATEEEAKREDFLREWQLLDKLRKTLDPKATAHEIAGQVLQEGKVFYYPRISVDKPHNKVNHAFLQQLPSDWVKIVGFNNVSKYTVAMNLMYFMQPGTDPLQFGDLLLPYLDDFYASAERAPEGTGKRVIFAARDRVDLNVLEQRRKQTGGRLAGDPEVYSQNGRWFYWVTLPVDKIFTFEADDVSRNAISPLAGLYLSLVQMAQYEQIQLELVQNPLIALFTGEIPYKDKSEITSTEDDYRPVVSDADREQHQRDRLVHGPCGKHQNAPAGRSAQRHQDFRSRVQLRHEQGGAVRHRTYHGGPQGRHCSNLPANRRKIRGVRIPGLRTDDGGHYGQAESEIFVAVQFVRDPLHRGKADGGGQAGHDPRHPAPDHYLHGYERSFPAGRSEHFQRHQGKRHHG